MHLLDYDEFNIYTSSCDIENYIENLIEEGLLTDNLKNGQSYTFV